MDCKNQGSADPITSNVRQQTTGRKQAAILRKIIRERDYYGILGLDKKCSSEDVKKAYKKLRRVVRPDLNPYSTKSLLNSVEDAFTCLNDREKRRIYDERGSFRSLFRRGRCIRLRIFLFVVYVLAGLYPLVFPFPQTYSLSPWFLYKYKVTTPKDVDFYVKLNNFDDMYPPETESRLHLESLVERDYLFWNKLDDFRRSLNHKILQRVEDVLRCCSFYSVMEKTAETKGFNTGLVVLLVVGGLVLSLFVGKYLLHFHAKKRLSKKKKMKKKLKQSTSAVSD